MGLCAGVIMGAELLRQQNMRFVKAQTSGESSSADDRASASRVQFPKENHLNLRKNQNTLTASEKQAFVSAVLGLKQRPSRLHPGDPNFGRYDDFVEVHLNAMMPPMMTPPQPGWAHQSGVFTPWHRALLLEFEKELQTANPAVTIPYWDWTQDSSPTSSLWTSDFLGGNGAGADGQVAEGPFAGSAGKWPIRVKDGPTDPDVLRRDMGADPTAKELPSASDQAAVLAMGPYDRQPWEDGLRANNAAAWQGYRPHLEVDLHNLVHRWVGGNMLDMTSPNDPVFWLHHCNCDRLWVVWQAQHPSELPYLPDSGAAQGHNLNDTMIFSEPGAIRPFDRDYRPVDVLNHHAVGIAYDTDPKDEVPTFEPKAWKEWHARMKATPAITSPPRSLPMFVLAAELPALAGPTVKGVPLNNLALKRIPEARLFRFSKAEAVPSSTKQAQSAVTPSQNYVCPVDGVLVTAQVTSSCQIYPSGTVNVECPNGHWATYICPSP
jgi:tyrosinase